MKFTCKGELAGFDTSNLERGVALYAYSYQFKERQIMNWKSPEEVTAKKIETRYVLVSGKYYHKIFPEGWEVIHSSDINHLDGKDWELVTISQESDQFYFGMPVERMGLMACMFPKEQVRELTETEKKAWSNKTLGMYGSHTDKLSYTFSLGNIK